MTTKIICAIYCCDVNEDQLSEYWMLCRILWLTFRYLTTCFMVSGI